MQLHSSIVFLSLLSLAPDASSQDPVEDAVMSLQEIITEIASQTEEETSLEEITEKLINLSEHPVPVNTATEEELSQLFWLSELQVQNLKKYMEDHGPILSAHELVYVPFLSEREAKLLAPFLSFESYKQTGPSGRDKHQIILRMQRILEKQKGYLASATPATRYKGNEYGYYFRYSLQKGNHVMAGLTAEKDPGEELFSGNNKYGFDFNSYYLRFYDFKFLKNIVLGDYRIFFGQGLVIWPGLNLGKSPVTMGSLQRTQGIFRYQSSDENNFFRGTAMTFLFKPFEWTLWYSSHPYDATISGRDSVTGRITEVSSLQNTGSHALSSEITNRDAVRCLVTGSNVTLTGKFIKIGLTGLRYSYSTTIQPDPEPYNLYYFRGRNNYNMSIDFRCRRGRMICFGEEAISRNGGWAMLNGLQSSAGSRLSFTLLNRYYRKNYQSMFGNAFGENSRNNNETGVFAGIECKPVKAVTFSGYANVFRFPWLTYSADMPSAGRDFFIQLTLDPSDRLQVYLQYRNKWKEENFALPDDVRNTLLPTLRKRVRLHHSYSVTNRLQWQNQAELSFYSNDMTKSKGFYLSQDLIFSPFKLPVKFYLRYAFFDTDDYSSRIYAYENDLLYVFRIPVLYDEGVRTYAMMRYSGKHSEVWLKYAVTRFTNLETIGTGPIEINGNQRSEIRMQWCIKL